MSTPSQLITVDLPDSNGKTTTYHTYDGYLEEIDRTRIRSEFNSLDRLKVSAAGIFGLAGYTLTRRISLPIVSLKGCSVPIAGLVSGIFAGLAGYQLFTFYGWSRKSSVLRDAVLGSKHVPLWSNLRNAVNPDRAYFELADDRHNEPLVFHSGLSAEGAGRIVPDKTIGEAPKKPHYPSAHGHH